MYDDNSESFPVRWYYNCIVDVFEDIVWHKFTVFVINRGAEFDETITSGPSDTTAGTEAADPGGESELPSTDPYST